MSAFKKIITFVIAFAVLFVIKEFLELYTYLMNISPYLAYIVLAVICAFTIYFVVLPIFNILRLPVIYGPAENETVGINQIPKRMINFRKNKFLLDKDYDFSGVNEDKTGYDSIVDVLSKECAVIRRKYVNQLFYSTSISQNGFLDAILILSASVNMIKEIFILYNGRVSNREVWIIAKKVYYSIVIGGSEGVEYATEEIYSKLATNSMKSIPFLDKIISSVVDGFINASLLTRVSLITENYCKLLYVDNDRDLYPSSKAVISTTKDITFQIIKKINETMMQMVKDKTENILMKGVNPVAVVMEKSYETIKESYPVRKSKNLFDDSVSFIKGVFE